jgi:hypothetical protein
MILRATADITDKDGNRLGLKNDVYVHHIIVANLARSLSLPPLVPLKSSCAPGQQSGKGMQGFAGLGGMSSPKGGAGHAHTKREAQFGGKGMPDIGALFNFDLFIVKGNEGDTQTFSPYNTANVKSGYWIGHEDKISAMVKLCSDSSRKKC